MPLRIPSLNRLEGGAFPSQVNHPEWLLKFRISAVLDLECVQV